LLSQISLSLASVGVHHDLLCNTKAKRFIGDLHTKNLGKSYYSLGAPVLVSSVDTLIRRDTSNWDAQVGLWIMDEAHHVLRSNKWGRAVEKFPNALGLGVTATPERADGRGLGAHASGFFHNMVESITMSELIAQGNLSDYEVFISPIARDVMHQLANVGKSFGDFNQKQAAEVLDKKYIIGDVVSQYKRHANGQRGLTFGQNVDHCNHMAQAYNAAGVPAVSLSYKTPTHEIWKAIEDFKHGTLLQLVNCALFGEGFDVPACAVASFVSATESFAKFAQEFGRPLRPMEGKKKAIILDHVGNVLRHRTPDTHRVWSLDDVKRGSRTTNEVKDINCLECLKPYDKELLACPFCDTPNDLFLPRPEQVGGTLKVVDDELVLMTREELQALWKDKEYIESSQSAVFNSQLSRGTGRELANVIASNHGRRGRVQVLLKDTMAAYINVLGEHGYSVDQARLKFARTFGIDVFSAQVQKEAVMKELTEKVRAKHETEYPL
jgi:DNA repair protein RadD